MAMVLGALALTLSEDVGQAVGMLVGTSVAVALSWWGPKGTEEG